MIRSLVLIATIASISFINAQSASSIELLAEQLDDLALNSVEAIQFSMVKSKANIEAPSDTYMLEVINSKGDVVAQDPFHSFMDIDVSNWQKGSYRILAHTFNGLEQREFRIEQDKEQ